MKKLLLDVDDVICSSGFLEAVNDFLGTSYVIDDFTDYYINRVAIPNDRYDEFNEFLNDRNMYENTYLLPGAIETVEKLNNLYDIYICSSCVNPFNEIRSGKMFKDKYDFLISTFPFLNPGNFIFTSAKNIIRADIQIDDRFSNLNNDIDVRILFPSYHNKDISDDELRKSGVIRAGYDWKDGWNKVEEILISQKRITLKR